jgi:hypothetical protein
MITIKLGSLVCPTQIFLILMRFMPSYHLFSNGMHMYPYISQIRSKISQSISKLFLVLENEGFVLEFYSPQLQIASSKQDQSLALSNLPSKLQNTQAASSAAPRRTTPTPNQPQSIRVPKSPIPQKAANSPTHRRNDPHHKPPTPPPLLNQPCSLPGTSNRTLSISASTSTIHPLRQTHHLPRTMHNPRS